jgi:NhaP-type Na+/H+ and K+/H+ antiporter
MEEIHRKHEDIINKHRSEINSAINVLDVSMEERLKKQADEYLKGYAIYVKEKEKDLRELIFKLHEKNSNSTLKDEIIFNLKQTIKKMNEEQIKIEGQKQEQNEKIKYWQARSQAYEQDKNFLQSQIIESKRQNKLLKLAIGRLQGELERKEEQLSQQQSVEPLNII